MFSSIVLVQIYNLFIVEPYDVHCRVYNYKYRNYLIYVDPERPHFVQALPLQYRHPHNIDIQVSLLAWLKKKNWQASLKFHLPGNVFIYK